MHAPRMFGPVLACLGAYGCFYDTMGGMNTGSTGEPPATGTTGDTPPPDPTTGAATTGTTGATGTTDAGDASTGTTGDATTSDPGTDTNATTGDTACPALDVQLLVLVEGSVVEPPMVTEESQLGEGVIAYSPVAEAGTVEFTVDLPCAGEYTVWGRVHDELPGTLEGNPDSYYARVDGGPEITWVYGCQTTDAEPGWTWQRIQAASGPLCDESVDWVSPLGPGPHAIRLRNRESARGFTTSASVARILVTNDPGFVPQGE